ncbi:hypothetical protein HYY74_06535 [Candidatus Woesearchaeota archaeon]|nr:hypothetical protein [Candidatus Woesearchaeota archaeon]
MLIVNQISHGGIRMINLAGKRGGAYYAGRSPADYYIIQELANAGIETVWESQLSKEEVEYNFTGRLRGWKFTRAPVYWVAEARAGRGLPLEVATELHYREYPEIEAALYADRGIPAPKTYGEVVRVGGHCGCPPPAAPIVDSYHIDTYQGLRELARVIREL